MERCREQAVRRFGKGGQRVFDESGECRASRLHDDQIVEPGTDGNCTFAVRGNISGLAFGARLHKGCWVEFSVCEKMLPGYLGKRNSRRGYLRVAIQKESHQFLSKFFHASRRRSSREGVDGILHRVGGEDLAVISGDEAGLEISFKQNLDSPFAKIVMVRMPLHSCQTDTRFAVTVFGQRNHRISFPGTSYSPADSRAEECENAIRLRAREM